MKTEIELPSDYDASAAREVGEELITYIVDRTRDGKGMDGQDFPGKYSDAYANSLEFEIAGKSQDDIDLTLTGEMLDSLQVLEVADGKVVIGYPKGSDINGRAEGNIHGSYGGEDNPRRARNFMAISDSEVEKVLEKFPVTGEKQMDKNTIDISRVTRERAVALMRRINFDDDGDL